ncbi:ABC transporter substrate-binding protein [Colwellia sp. MB02u-18]|nr:ABC transporter substrate-binding protein [Colwellia sp. MB3u-45]MBA6266680.1 ABC transporter substrate-binding protein [Colwellia sp. MB3u-43]MBA6320613.1 ABC transporter substrate-binding protein [Colwellia sp. MB02u-19]MBA6323866.1 ABC transporter substrate-binding protein [Colwellia sp. MB02u-18]MBA6329714.1 ABC transporter substrate-binding protein [Colwellia sp. MB02u-12]MBA6344906.1 ABC transporter substrate-binding protein [Colwellia sp. MB02u-1]
MLFTTSSLSYANTAFAATPETGSITSTETITETSSVAKVNSVLISNNSPIQTKWSTGETLGKNPSVYFHAWGGDPQINSYIQWLAKRVKQEYNIDLQHVKLTDTSEAVSRVLAEKSANNHQQGQVDLVWINGENFASMAKYQLLAQGWVAQLPNFWLTNPKENEAMTRDFGLPTQGMEAPWGQASLTFYYTPSINVNKPKSTYQDSIRHAPKNISQLLTWAEQNPGRFTYPKPPDFLSLSFLKYALITLNQHQPAPVKSGLYQAVTKQSQATLLPILWTFLDKLHPYLWHQGRYFVASGTALQRLVGDGEINLGFTFSAAQVPAAVERYNLPQNTRSFVMQDGSLSNIHFIAIPYNAANSDAAKVVANFMLSVEAQAKKQQAKIWGDSTVLDVSQLSQQEQLLFSIEQQHPSALPVSSKITALSEPHPSWSILLTREWLKRYGAQ